MTNIKLSNKILALIFALLLVVASMFMLFASFDSALAESVDYTAYLSFFNAGFSNEQSVDGINLFNVYSAPAFSVVPSTFTGSFTPTFFSGSLSEGLNFITFYSDNILVFTAPEYYYFKFVKLKVTLSSSSGDISISAGSFVRVSGEFYLYFDTPVSSFTVTCISAFSLLDINLSAVYSEVPFESPDPLPPDFPLGSYLLSNSKPDFSHVAQVNQVLNGSFSAVLSGELSGKDSPLISSYTVSGNQLYFSYAIVSSNGSNYGCYQLYIQNYDYQASTTSRLLIATVYDPYSLVPTPTQSLPLSITIDSILEPTSNDAYGALMDWLTYAYTYYSDTPIYSDGFSAGYDSGYDKGYASGAFDGYNQATNRVNTSSASYVAGYNAGIASTTDYSFTGLLSAVIDVPLQAFTSLFNFEILGVNMKSFALSIFTILALVAIGKLVTGFFL